MRYETKSLPAIDWEWEYETVEARRREAAEDFASGAPGAAAACGDLADRLRDAGRPGEAEPLYREALGLWRELARIRPTVWLPLLAESCGDLADLLAEAGQAAEALDLSREALGLWRELDAADTAWRPDLAENCGALADLLADAGAAREAEALSREALELWRELARGDAAWEADLADACRSLADLLASSDGTGGLKPGGMNRAFDGFPSGVDTLSGVPALSPARAKEAEVLYCEALDLYRTLARRHPRCGTDAVLVCNNLGTLLCGQGRKSAGEWFYRQAIDLHRKQADHTDSAPFAASACGNLAGSMEERNPAEAERLYRSALEAWRKLVRRGGEDLPGTPSMSGNRCLREAADACFRLASFLFTVRGDGDGAESLMREALSYLRRDTRHAEAAARIRRTLAEWGLAEPIIELPAALPAANLAEGLPGEVPEEPPGGLPGELPEEPPKGLPWEVPEEPPEGLPGELPEEPPVGPLEETPEARTKEARQAETMKTTAARSSPRHGRPPMREEPGDKVRGYKRVKHAGGSRYGGWYWADAEQPRRWARPGKGRTGDTPTG